MSYLLHSLTGGLPKQYTDVPGTIHMYLNIDIYGMDAFWLHLNTDSFISVVATQPVASRQHIEGAGVCQTYNKTQNKNWLQPVNSRVIQERHTWTNITNQKQEFVPQSTLPNWLPYTQQ